MKLAEVGDAEIGLGFDAMLGGSRESAQHQLTVDEKRVGGAVYEIVPAGLQLGQHPRRAHGPAKQIRRPWLIDDADACEADGLARPVAIHDHRTAVGYVQHADHGRVGNCTDED